MHAGGRRTGGGGYGARAHGPIVRVVSDPANILPGLDSAGPLPYKIACLCDLRDKDGRVLLLRRGKAPNKGLCSPIGGKLEMETGESPAQCAQREIREEASIEVPIERLHLLGLISEAAFEDESHWLLFYYRVMGAVEVKEGPMNEGSLEWFRPEEIEGLPLPDTDRQIIWPLVRKHETSGGDGGLGFFALHIDCAGESITWNVEQETPESGA